VLIEVAALGFGVNLKTVLARDIYIQKLWVLGSAKKEKSAR
jgi:hypothetical protein